MNAADVYLLGRKLMKIAEAAFPADPDRGALPTSVRMVLVDVSQHPASSIREITERTGFPQSHVSASVARLREQGIFQTSLDPNDGRRTLVTLADSFRKRIATRRAVPIETALAAALGNPEPDDLSAVTDALKTLSQRLTPGARRPPARSSSGNGKAS